MDAATLLDVFSRLDDPRCRRGVRHPFAGIVVLTLLGMLARMREMEVLVRWAKVHWDQLREPLGFDRDEPPCATTISRTLAKCSVAQFQEAFSVWLQACLAQQPTEGVIAVDGKTSKQGLDDGGRPLHMLQVFLHDVRAVLGQWSTGAEKTNEPTVLRRHLKELLEAYPMLYLLTGDAMFAQRPLIELIREQGCHYLFQIKGNQGDALDALQNCFAGVARRRPAAETVDKKGLGRKSAVFGLT